MFRKRKRNLCLSAAKLTGDSTCLLLDINIYRERFICMSSWSLIGKIEVTRDNHS